MNVQKRVSPLWYVSTELLDLSDMKASDMKKELESYGVSTKSLFDKAEIEKALRKERDNQEKEGVESIKDRINLGADSTSTKQTEKHTGWGGPRPERATKRDKWAPQASTTNTGNAKYDNAFQEGLNMKISELKQELRDRGISTSAFFEKVDMAKAYAQAIVDNIFKKRNGEGSKATGTRDQTGSYRSESYDPSYRDVTVERFNAGLTILPGDTVIDITDVVKGATNPADSIWQ
jgi:predicted HTH domain antitoxin